jgi:hypothetical protein
VKVLQEKASVERLKLPKLEESKWFVVVYLWRTRVDISLTSGEITPGKSECGEVETPKA